MALTAKQILDLNRMNAAAQRAELGTVVNGLLADVVAAEGDIDGLETRMTAAEGDVGTLETNLGLLQTQVGAFAYFKVIPTTAQATAKSVPVDIGEDKVYYIVQMFTAAGVPVAVTGAAVVEGVMTVTAAAMNDTDVIMIFAA